MIALYVVEPLATIPSFAAPYLLQSNLLGKRYPIAPLVPQNCGCILNSSKSACIFFPFILDRDLTMRLPSSLVLTLSKLQALLLRSKSYLASNSLAQVILTFVVFPLSSSLLLNDFIIPPKVKPLHLNIAARPTLFSGDIPKALFPGCPAIVKFNVEDSLPSPIVEFILIIRSVVFPPKTSKVLKPLARFVPA